MRLLVASVVLSVVGVPAADVQADLIDPRGVFFHRYTGPFSAIEWIHIWDIEGEHRYRFSDIRGIAPYDGVISPQGTINWDSMPDQSGSGSFITQDHATQTLIYQNGTYQSTLRRAPGTDASFITRIDSREQGAAIASGSWNLTIDTLDAETGALLGTLHTSALTVVNGELFRLEQADGTFYQGVFETGIAAGFRVVAPRGITPEFDSFDGSATSWTSNLLGDFRMLGDDAFSATMLLQSRRQPGQQTQTVYRLTGSRVPAPGGATMVLALGLAATRRQRKA
jgi:hypothetical protein